MIRRYLQREVLICARLTNAATILNACARSCLLAGCDPQALAWMSVISLVLRITLR